MLQNRESKLVLYSLGIVVITKQAGSDQITVYPVEEIPVVLGPISKATKQLNISMPDATGAIKNSAASSKSTITATWIPDGDNNRMTAPDVVANETVKIYRYADTDKYYWTTIFREPSLRRLEDVVYMYGNIPDGQTPYDENTSYWVEYSTVGKFIKIHTSANDGEKCEYDITLDTSLGSLTIQDSLGNIIVLDSAAGKLTATINNEVDVNTLVTNINSSNEVNIKTNTTTVNSDSGVTINTQSAVINAPDTKITGNVEVGGTLTVAKNLIAVGDITGNAGAFTVSNGNLVTPGTITGSLLIGPLANDPT